MSLKLNTPFPIFAPSLFPNHNPRAPSEIRFSRWGNANAERFEQRRRSQEELEAEIRRDRRFDAATKIVHTHDSEAAAAEPKTSPFRSRGTPSLPSARSIPGRRSKYSKPDSGPNRPKNKPRVPDSPPQLDAKPEVKLSEDGLTYVINGAPFEFKYSYTETPKVKPLKLREPAYAPFGPTTMGRPWTGRAPLPQSQKTPREFDSFRLPPVGKKGLKPVQKPGPFRPGVGPRYVYSKEEILGEPLTKEEVRELVTSCLKTTRQLNMGRDGLTHNMLNNIHDLWKRRRVCKIKCKGVCTVDMDNVCEQLEEKIGGKVIYRRGGVLFLFRGRNYNHRTRPRFPLMLWKPVAPVYPRLIQQVPEGLTRQEATNMRRKGRELMPICKLGKNGVYCDLVKNVKEAFEVCELVRIDCQGMKGSDFRKIGAKLKDLVPCVLVSFENEQILIWRGREWKSSLTTPDKKGDILEDIEVDTALPEDDEPSVSPNQSQTMTQNPPLDSMELQNDPDGHDLSPSTVDSSEMEGTINSLQSWSTKDVTEPTVDSFLRDLEEPEDEPETSEEISKQSIERVLILMKQAVESGTALVLDAADLDADTVFSKAVAFSSVASPGPVFQHGLRKQPTVKKQESQEFGYGDLEAKSSNVVVSRNASKSSNVVVFGKREVASLAMAVCNCFLQAPPLSRILLPVLSRRATTLSAGYGRLKSTVTFCSTVNRTSPLTSSVRAEVKRVSRKDDKVASATDVQFETPLKIVEYPDPILRAKNKRIDIFDENLKNLVDAMFDVMYKTDGIGLSAPQVGLNVQLMVFNPAGEPGEGKEIVLVNPKIKKYSDKLVPFDEGCLSFPGIYAEVVRPQSVKIDARDITGERFSISLSRLPARIFQHEYDHLEGVLFFDRMTDQVLDSIREELEALEKKYEEKTGLPSPERVEARQKRKAGVGFGKR